MTNDIVEPARDVGLSSAAVGVRDLTGMRGHATAWTRRSDRFAVRHEGDLL